ncbi:MAG: hypothetical protein ABIH92_00195 [Nanoarchaeota archaeon]
MANEAVSDTGPIIHLTEIDLTKALFVFSKLFVPREVENELKRNKTTLPKRVRVLGLSSKTKEISNILFNRFDLDLGEAQAIALALQEKVQYFLTDDLDARFVAREEYGLEVHGTIGLVLRAFRNGLIGKVETVGKLRKLYEGSSLFVTRALIDEAVKAVEGF